MKASQLVGYAAGEVVSREIKELEVGAVGEGEVRAIQAVVTHVQK